MESALDIIDRALCGEEGARQFIERTSSVYVLDLTDLSQPKTYGCWDFIHQALNEIERLEASQPPGSSAHHATTRPLVCHARLLAKVALRVARRSFQSDKALLSTAIANAAKYTPEQSKWLVDANLELRDIVMGRIAAMAFDFSFHRQSNYHSACADRIVMDTFAAILSANAVVSGPASIENFATKWIIPSSKSLPSFAVAAVVCHLGAEGARRSVPFGTQNMLQQLSTQVMSIVLVPMLSEAISGGLGELEDSALQHKESSSLATMCLRAMKAWCDVTELSLPQIKHICSKSEVNIVSILSDTLYSDSHDVVDAVADLLETTIPISDEKTMSHVRMNQVKFILGVDEESFKAKFSPQQLKIIESSEMASIVEELASAIGLQRFRFVERQKEGDFQVCLNLTRVASCVCNEWCNIMSRNMQSTPESGAIEFLVKAASHPSLSVCALALSALTQLLTLVPALATEVLRILQRRAIWPNTRQGEKLVIESSDVNDESQGDFDTFRETVLADSLVSCWTAQRMNYLSSCVSAVEEFCAKDASAKFSLPLEAALFCLEVVAEDLLAQQEPWDSDNYMNRLLAALQPQPPLLMSTSFGRERLCSFLCSYTCWFVRNGKTAAAATLAMSCFLASARHEQCSGFLFDSSDAIVSPRARHSSKALHTIMLSAPSCFAGLWEASYEGLEHKGVVTIDDRLTLLRGICYVICSLQNDERKRTFEEIFALSLHNLEKCSLAAKQAIPPLDPNTLRNVADEIRILSSWVVGLSGRKSVVADQMENCCDTSSEQTILAEQHLLEYVRKGWPHVRHAAQNFGGDEAVASAVGSFCSDLLPSTKQTVFGIELLNELCDVVSSTIQRTAPFGSFDFVYSFVEEFVVVHGELVENSLLSPAAPLPAVEMERAAQVAGTLEKVMLGTITTTQNTMGDTWAGQNGGQSPYQSTLSPSPKPAKISSESLGCLLSMLTVASNTCPGFLCQLVSRQGKENYNIVHRAVASSVAALNDSTPTTTRNAIAFLSSMVQHTSSQHPKLHSTVNESFSAVGVTAIEQLLLGVCGNYPRDLVPAAAELVKLLLLASSDEESMLGTSLRPDHFFLGEYAKRVVLSYCLRSAISKDVSSADLADCLLEVWRLHQSEDTNALATSDAVAQLLSKYRIP